MATLRELITLVHSSTELKYRFGGAMLKACWDVMNEDAGTENHANRIALAKLILRDHETFLDRYWALFLSNSTIQTAGDASTDNDIQFVVNSFYDTMANAEAS